MMAEQEREGVAGERGAEWDQQGDNWTLKLFSCLAAFTDMEDDTKVWTVSLIIIFFKTIKRKTLDFFLEIV